MGVQIWTLAKKNKTKDYEVQQQILNKFAGMAEGPEKYTLLRKKYKGMFQYRWSKIEKFRYIEYVYQNKPVTFPSLTKEQFEEIRKEFYSNQPIVLTCHSRRDNFGLFVMRQRHHGPVFFVQFDHELSTSYD